MNYKNNIKNFALVYFKYFTSHSSADLETVLRNMSLKGLQNSPEQISYLCFLSQMINLMSCLLINEDLPDNPQLVQPHKS